MVSVSHIRNTTGQRKSGLWSKTRNVGVIGLVAVVAGCTNVSLPGVGTDHGNAIEPPVSTRPPSPDSRGVISFPTYQAVRARQGETVNDIAARLEIDPSALALRNGLDQATPLREGELLLLPVRIEEEGAGLAALVNDTLQETPPPDAGAVTVTPAQDPDAPVPVQHVVERGETAYSIARLYNVSVRSLADWNSLPSDYSVREGQVLMIPLPRDDGTDLAALAPSVTGPGVGTPTPTPPSARTPLPNDTTQPAANTAVPDTTLAAPRTAASDTTRLAKPVAGSILRPYKRGTNDGVDFGAPAGASVVAAEAGVVVAITRDVDQVPIIVLRHADDLLTVYANVDAIKVVKDQEVSRGQQLGVVLSGDPSYLHFEVRQGFESMDPTEYF